MSNPQAGVCVCGVQCRVCGCVAEGEHVLSRGTSHLCTVRSRLPDSPFSRGLFAARHPSVIWISCGAQQRGAGHEDV